jgi:glutamate N-acetyltransferase / amino-acid N-acetyltransferase
MKNLEISPLAPIAFPQMPQIFGMKAATFSLGMYKSTRDDLLIINFPDGASVGGAFTKSNTRSCDVEWCASSLKSGLAYGLVVNAGNSNAFTGQAGVDKNNATLEEYCALSGANKENIFLSATGVIGVPVACDLISSKLPEIWPNLGAPDFEKMAKAIATTDTYIKGCTKSFDIDGQKINIVGIAKGSGMIAPNMATMLVYIFTDAKISSPLLQEMVSQHVETTFNAITVDSDTSTSDTLLVFATNKIGQNIEADSNEAVLFSEHLSEVMLDLALQVVKDGEGASKFITIEINGAKSKESAKNIAMAIANSPLVKTAIAGGDANWGRVAMAVGKCQEPINIDKLAIRFCGQWVAKDGGAAIYDEAKIDKLMEAPNIEILVDVGVGAGEFIAYTCDLTHGYISINGDYRS